MDFGGPESFLNLALMEPGINCSLACILRAGSIGNLELSDFFAAEMDTQAKNLAMIAGLMEGKTNRSGNTRLTNMIGAIDPLVCPIGAVAMMFFERLHFQSKCFWTLPGAKIGA